MLIEDFAQQYRLKVKKDSCGDLIIPGRARRWMGDKPEDRNHVYEHNGTFLAYLSFPLSRKRWNNAKKRLQDVGCGVKVDVDGEGIVVFDPSDERQVGSVLKECFISAKRTMSDEQRQAIRGRLARNPIKKNSKVFDHLQGEPY